MKYLLDTNICIYIIKKKPESVLKKITKLDPQQMGISSVTWSELIYGAEKSQLREKNLEALKKFIVPFEVFSFSEKEAEKAGEIRAELERIGKPIGPYDILIAAHAKTLNLTLVTHNEKEFHRIKGLKVETWVS